VKNVQDLRRTAGFDGLDASEGGSLLLSELAALVAFALVGSFSPGPNNAVLWASGISFGFRRTIPHVIGGALGVGTLVVGVAAGIGALLEAVPAATTVLRVAGSAYLLYLAFQVAGGGAIGRTEVSRPLGIG
jgi:threonine/homoserine/homoserine lactone efflux protein